MTMQPQEGGPAGARRRDRTAGIVLGAASVLAIVLMGHHPTGGGGEIAEAIGRIARLAPLNRIVHGGLIALIGAILFAFVEVAGRLGWHRARTRAGMIAYASGILSLAGAALVNGFVLSGLAERYAGADAAALEACRHLMRFCWEANQALAGAGVAGMSAGIVLWSLVLAARGGYERAIGALGLMVGGATLATLLTGLLQLHLQGMMIVMVSQAVWNLCVAVWIGRDAGRAGERDQEEAAVSARRVTP